jgi:hypothetical protein
MGLLATRIRWNSIYRKLFVTYLALTALGTSLLASYILWSFYGYFMNMRQDDLDNWSSALSESVADALEDNQPERVELLVKRYGAPESVTLRVFRWSTEVHFRPPRSAHIRLVSDTWNEGSPSK